LRGEADRLLHLIDEILDLTRLESGKLVLKRTEVPLLEIAHAAVETVRPMAARHQVELVERHESDLPVLRVDEVKMRQVVVNLVVNAVKFSPEGSQVVVSTEREPSYLRLEVADNGAGVSPEKATHIFELFGQGVNEIRPESTGVGIGLHLVKRISELHGGHVGVNSTVGQGSRFWVRLPLSLAETEGADELPDLLEAADLEKAA
jgi:two-component system CheB/CheR fusion protein